MAEKYLTTLMCFLLLSSVKAISYTDCGSKSGTEIWDVKILGCDNLDKCELVRGNKTTLDVKFRTDSNANEINMRISGKILGTFIPFPYPSKDACQNGGLLCPLQPGQNYTYHAEVDVKEIYPPIEVGLRLKLTAIETEEDLFCLIIPAKVV